MFIMETNNTCPFKVTCGCCCQKTLLILADTIVGLYFLSGIVLITKHSKKQLELKFLPLCQIISILLNCLFWIASTESKKEEKLATLIINAIGLVIGGILLFLCWAKSYSEQSDWFIGILNICNIFLIIAVSVGKQFLLITQIIASIFNVLMYLSLLQNPLLIYLKQSYQQGSLPFLQLIVGLLSSFVWIIYGVLTCKPEVSITNSIGLFFLITILIFCIKIKKEFKKNERLGLDSIISEGIVSQSQIETDTQGE